jgi:hypothetical protein
MSAVVARIDCSAPKQPSQRQRLFRGLEHLVEIVSV